MSGVEVIAVVACVAAVVSAYSDGAKLFHTLRKKRERRRQSHETIAADLESSLARGQTEILTHWNAHTAQLGKRYEMGDSISREQMKDIVITLQGMLLSHLRASVENNANLDMMAVLLASNHGRARTISVLHELYERIALDTPVIRPLPTGPPTIDPRSSLAYHMQFVDTRDSQRSAAPNGWPIPSATRRTPLPGRVIGEPLASSPTDITGFSGMMSEPSSPPRRRSSGFGTQMSVWWSSRSRKGSKSTAGSSNDVTEEAEVEPPGRLAVMPEDHEEPKAISRPRSKPRRIKHRSMDEIDVIKSVYNTQLTINPWADSGRPDSGVEVDSDTESDDSAAYEMAKESPSTESDQMVFSTEPSTSPTSLEPPHLLSPTSRSPPAPSIFSTNSHASSTSNNTLAPPVPYSIDDKAYWPPRKANHFSGFCQGAWGLRAGTSNFKLQYEPFGIYAHTMRWGCPSCFFGMPLASPVTKRKDASIDSSVHRHPATGIKYRWMFLAKSHIPKKDGVSKSMGFGCVFCCVELDACAPILHSVNDFMGHLASHRGVDHAGLLEMMKCVTGRVADDGENFEINIPPSD